MLFDLMIYLIDFCCLIVLLFVTTWYWFAMGCCLALILVVQSNYVFGLLWVKYICLMIFVCCGFGFACRFDVLLSGV